MVIERLTFKYRSTSVGEYTPTLGESVLSINVQFVGSRTCNTVLAKAKMPDQKQPDMRYREKPGIIIW